MNIFAIESSMDETATAVVADGQKILASTVASSKEFHKKTRGVVPEVAARKQLEFMIPVVDQTLSEARLTSQKVDAVAVTTGPGMIGSLLVGVETAKTLAFVWEKPLIPTNHLLGHLYASWLNSNPPDFPLVALIVSGGHTLLLLVRDHGVIEVLGETQDDAAGEAFDKVGTLLGIDYPAGPEIDQLSKKGDPSTFDFPRPLITSGDLNFSFSGLKVAVLRQVKDKKIDKKDRTNLAASFQQAAVDVLVKKTLTAARDRKVRNIVVSGGVAANSQLRETFKNKCDLLGYDLFTPPVKLCTDNAAVIAAAAYFNQTPAAIFKVTADPNLRLV